MSALADFSELHEELRAVARDLLARHPEPAWSAVGEAGWAGLEVPEALEGAGATFAEVAVVLEELGRATASTAYLGTVVLGAGALLLAEPSQAQASLLAAIAGGESAVALATAPDDAVLEGTLPFTVERAGGQVRVRGSSPLVPDAPGADRLLLLADDAGVPALVVVEPGHAGLAVTELPLLDETRRFGEVAADAVVAAELVWALADPDAPARLAERGALALACDSLGLGEAMLDATVAYARVREQFGRPIGSFQAVKHGCANMLVELTIGRELVAAAIETLVSGGPQAPIAVGRAAAFMGARGVDIAGQAMQLHGGIGYTWESGVHRYLKRAVLNRALFGTPRAHRRRLAGRLLLGG